MRSGQIDKEVGILGGKCPSQEILRGTYTAPYGTDPHTIAMQGLLHNSELLLRSVQINTTVSRSDFKKQ